MALTAQRASLLAEEIRQEIVRLNLAGFHLLPLGRGDDGKTPGINNWTAPKVKLGQVLAPLHRHGVGVYGVRLDGLAVIDCDNDDLALVAEMESRFGSSPVHVLTPRGRHLYYRAGGAIPNLRAEGLPVDLKSGGRSYVVGPLSQRPDGERYVPVKGVLGVDGLPVIYGAKTATGASVPIRQGERHQSLVSEAIAMVETVSGPGELAARLFVMRDERCEAPSSMPDAELRGIADWTWQHLLRGELYQGRDSAFPVHRLAHDALRGKPGGSDAIALYVLLVDLHGHDPGKRFALDHGAMKAAGLTDLSVRGFRAARRMLENAGLLGVATKYRPGSHRQQYRLERLRPGMAAAANVERISEIAPRGKDEEKRGKD
ncbi:bifunctional DNA primase/polymerase [Thioclava sp. NG1]|uniref:bifunctional DNA primase/polymerase n=1 Tax=Thioclava sp. NG1 TaxID=2182426 RepID=UPI0013049CF6|nr:bifunctional DNA primase/polymerase [Thioclava sp. NG1]